MPRGVDESGWIYGEIEKKRRYGTSHGLYKSCQGWASVNSRTTKSGMEADKERKLLDYFVRSYQGIAR